MPLKYITGILLLTTLILSGCVVSSSDSNIQYNRIYENIQIETMNCGNSHQLIYKDNGEKRILKMNQVDCLYLIENHKHLKRFGEYKDFSINFISDGEFIDGIIINK